MYQESIALIRHSIFPVFLLKQDGSKNTAMAAGTGFFISESGHFLTANHVIKSMPDTAFRPVYYGNLPFSTTGKPIDIIEIYSDAKRDIYLGKVDSGFLPPVTLTDEKQNDGKSVVLSGYPLPVIRQNNQGGFDLSNVRQYWQPTILIDQFEEFKIDAAAFSAFMTQHPALNGMSGAPLFDLEGKTLGISVATFNRSVPQNDGGVIRVDNGIAVKISSLSDVIARIA